MPSLNWLRVFEAAARTESFARAAEQLNMSAPAVSQQIRALEGHLGKALFERRAQQVRLTDAGRAFLPVVSQSLAAVETTAATLFGDPAHQSVTLQAVTVLAMSWLPDVLATFEAAHPTVSVSLITGNMLSDFRTILPGREPDLQIAFGSATDFPDSAEQLFGETLSAVASPDIASSVDSVQGLIGHRLIEVATHRSGWHQILARDDSVSLDQMRFVMVDSTPLAFMLAAQGHGIALARAPATDAMEKVMGLRRLPCLAPVSGQQRYYLLHPEARATRRATLVLRDWILAAARQDVMN
jgi:LysR family glycine cleavage system transcriptional activator